MATNHNSISLQDFNNIVKMSDHQTTPPNSTINPYDFLQIVRNPDGTITHLFEFPSTPAAPDLNSTFPVLTKDVALNPKHNTWLRIFLPRQAPDISSATKLPIIVYYHGGGFIRLSAATTVLHDFCSEMAIQLSAMIISVEYRLAPEHRLPAAYDDAMDSLNWIKCTPDEWLRDFADFSNCFIMGISAGGNIAYHAGLRAAAAVKDLEPLMIKGLVLHHPFFGGSERTKSELRMVNDPVLPLCANDLMWELALPTGADRDHEYCNPTNVGGGSDHCEQIRLLGWQFLVAGCNGDPLIDRQMELVKTLERKGVRVMGHEFGEGGYHGVEVLDITKAKPLFVILKKFIEQCSTSSKHLPLQHSNDVECIVGQHCEL